MPERVRVAIAGVGNCAAAFVQAVAHYGENPADGAITPMIDGLHPDDIEFVAAFDVAAPKVGHTLAEAVFAAPNLVRLGSIGIERMYRTGAPNVIVEKGPLLDGLAEHMRSMVTVSGADPENVPATLRAAGAEVLVNYMPVGADDAARFYASAALDAGCGFVNAMPSFIASTAKWQELFADAHLPLIGDDVKGQFGATYLHRALVTALKDRGVDLLRTYQLNVGGNTDFLNMTDPARLTSKRQSKTQAVTSQFDHEIPGSAVHIGPSDYVPWLGDDKVAFIRLEAAGCCGARVDIEVRLHVADSAQSAGVMLDAVRYCAMAKRRRLGGVLTAPSAWLMKSPPTQLHDALAKIACDLAAAGDWRALNLP